MKKDVTVKEFVEGYSKSTNSSAKKIYVQNVLKAEKYIPYAYKLSLAEVIVEKSSYAYESPDGGEKAPGAGGDSADSVQSGRIKINSNLRFVGFIFTVFQAYTNVKMDGSNILEEFDMLNREGLVDVVISYMMEDEGRKRDLDEFKIVVQRTFEDFMTNNYESHAFISKQVGRIADVLKVVMKPVAEKIAGMGEEDLEKITGIIEKTAVSVK